MSCEAAGVYHLGQGATAGTWAPDPLGTVIHATMKCHRAILVPLLMSLLACTNEWSPPKNPDPQQVLSEAQDDVNAKRYEEALAKFVWFHRNALTYDRSFYGVRLSFALMYWHDLGKVHPPALEKLREFRDEAMKNFTNGKDVRESFHDFVAINRTLGEEERTRDAFVLLDTENAATAKNVYSFAESALIDGKAYELWGKYIDPKKSFRRMLWLFRQNRRFLKEPHFGARERDIHDLHGAGCPQW